MPYTAEHKERTRARIVESARKLFNRHGFEQVSIETIMSEAGLTRGGFYNHFDSKDELYAAAVASFATCNPFRKDVARAPVTDQRDMARRLVNLYLSDEVLEDIENHCPPVRPARRRGPCRPDAAARLHRPDPQPDPHIRVRAEGFQRR